MLKRAIAAACTIAGGLSLALAVALPAHASTTLWTARNSDGRVVLDDWPVGPSSGQAGAFVLTPVPGESVSTDNFLGFQFAPDGTLWTARNSDGRVVLDDWPVGPSGGQAGAFVLTPVPGESVSTDNFLGFQFAPDGTLWTARNSDGRVVLDDWPVGPSSGQAGAFVLTPVPGESVSTDNFLGFQFAPDGRLWTARNADGRVVLDDWPVGPSSGQAGAFVLTPVPGESVSTDNFLGFQFAPDGRLWTARNADGRVVLDDWPVGPSSGQAGAFVLTPVPGESVSTDSFLGFQFVSVPDEPGGTPVPEPSTWALLILGFGVAGGALRRQRLAQA